MTRHYNVPHSRGLSTYSKKGKGRNADKYGVFSQGAQQSQDRIAGKAIWSIVEKKEDK
jgi:hypothetical protein